MYSTWWSFALQAATTLAPDGRFAFSPPDFSAAASEISKTTGGPYAKFDPVGLSQLFSVARTIGSANNALNAAGPGDRLDPGSMSAEAPFSRTDAAQSALPVWYARTEVEYLDETGTPQKGTFTVAIPQVLPPTVGSLRAQLALRIQDMLDTPEGPEGGTPRGGTFGSIIGVSLLQV